MTTNERASPITILAISGSLRRASLNTALLRAAALLAPENVVIDLYDGLGMLPHFNPDLEDAEPRAVADLRRRVRAADGLLIASPEYAHGVSGVMKNALDWLVSGEEFVYKPVALLNASPRATQAYAALLETVTVMSAYVVAGASITVPVLGKNPDAREIAGRPEIAQPLRSALAAFATAIRGRRAEAPERE
ncbi:MAG: NADPH-dependent FMN reductase [Sulfurifustaceae bacterium]